jgi:hypothetical protein
MEEGSGPTLSDAEVRQAFKLGYGIAFTESALSAESYE